MQSTVVLDTRVVCGSGGGPDKTILNSPRFLAPAGYRMVCAYMHPPADAGGETARVTPSGELDMATVAEFEAQLRGARERGFRRLVVDLRELDFMDSTGLTLLTRWTLDARSDGFEFAVIPGSERIQRLFELTRLSPHFTFLDG